MTNPYTVEKSPIHQTTKVNTSWSVLNKKINSPPKKRKRKICSSVGNPSTVQKYASFPFHWQRMLAFALTSLDCTVPAESDGYNDVPIDVTNVANEA